MNRESYMGRGMELPCSLQEANYSPRISIYMFTNPEALPS